MSLAVARLRRLGPSFSVPLTRRFSLCPCIPVLVTGQVSPDKCDLVVTWRRLPSESCLRLAILGTNGLAPANPRRRR